MEYQATAKYIHTSTRKVRLVADGIRKIKPQDALIVLARMPKSAAEPILKVIQSAIAGAKDKNADITKLKFKTIEVMGGPAMKRWQAVSRGMGHAYKKRMSHVRIILTDEIPVGSKALTLGGNNGTKS
jgi:large subunit ribosomal protein L22